MPTITFVESGERFEVPAGTSFLAFCQEHDAPHDFGCTMGTCGVCRAVLVEGADRVEPITAEEQTTIDMVTDEQGVRLGCQLVVNGDVSVRQAD